MNPRLTSYLSFAGLALISGVAKGQIVYTDIVPDALITPPLGGGIQSFLLDMDQDGISDFKIVADSSSYVCSSSSSYSSNWYTIQVNKVRLLAVAPLAEIGTAANTNCSNFQKLVRYNLNQSLTINNPAPTAYFFLNSTCNCNSVGGGSYYDIYAGLKFVKGGQTRLGWLRFTQIDEILILKDFAYCDGNTTTLPAGTLNYNVGLSELESSFLVQSEGRVLKLHSSEGMPFSAQVFSLLGQEIATMDAQQGTAEYLFKNAGVYLLKVQSSQGIFTRKIYITD